MRMTILLRSFTLGLRSATLLMLAACAPDYSPNTYNATAVQQANKVETAIVIGFRQVEISAAGTVGAVTGGAAGGILGAQIGPNNTASALGTVGGGIVGSLLGSSIEHATADTTGWEYIVRKANGDLLSVTQRELKPLPLGQKVLVITGTQARIIPDYSIETPAVEKEKEKPPAPPKPPEPTPVTAPAPVTEPIPASAPMTEPAPPPAPESPAPPRPQDTEPVAVPH